MLSRNKKSTVLALAAGLAITLSACATDTVEEEGTGAAPSAPSAEPSPAAAIDSLSGKQTAVTLDPSFLAGLTSLKLEPGVVGGATLNGAKIAFPITGGNVTYFDPKSGVDPFVQGMIVHNGSGLSLTGGGKVVELTDFVVDPEKSMLTGKVTVDDKVAVESAPLFFLDGSTVNPLMVNAGAGTAVLEGTTVSLTKAAADLLNKTFGSTALKEFFTVGIAEITLELPK
ncbi:MAG: hypothetical protein KY451_06980 [Actinobacteria bacterium]|nr:hypothetical protein [Actinomycetota bacterium]MBW3646621.1 hypothetical protein [Actinomycetota bacterium]